ncbi:MAG: prephenate dehydrogenase/arogenate dehydrogenase family protein [Betaproteobacteria bacterium]|nr:prephenate dehydrogenase/arogenate dehydrogenase family protein [Betaproteobacteria bacterium]
MPAIEKLVLVGAGLIGGSFSLALKRAAMVGCVVGVGRTAATMAEAKRLGIVDEIASDYSCVSDATLVMLAMPVGQTRTVLRELAPQLGPSTVVTDAGSTKCDVVLAAREELGAALGRFVPGHPVAGTEHSGPGAAFADLYQGRRVVLTPLQQTNAAALAVVRDAWIACGARVFELTPELHDQVLATVSHLPHLLAFALVDLVASETHAEQLFSFAAGGFRDFTRIASSHPEMWRDICLANKDALLAELGKYEGRLAALRAALAAGNGVELEKMFSRARAARNRWLDSSGQGPSS